MKEDERSPDKEPGNSVRGLRRRERSSRFGKRAVRLAPRQRGHSAPHESVAQLPSQGSTDSAVNHSESPRISIAIADPARSSVKTPIKPATALAEIHQILLRAFPDRKKTFWERLYEAVHNGVKFVGIPAVIIAAISPLTDVWEAYVENHNKQLLIDTYTTYGNELLAHGDIDRASNVMGSLEVAQKRDVKTQYAMARISSSQAIKQGKNYQNAADQIELLLRLQRSGGFFFPRLGGPNELLDLQLVLIDIDLKRGEWNDAERKMNAFAKEIESDTSTFAQSGLLLRRGTLAVLRNQFRTAQNYLRRALVNLRHAQRSDLLAECYFELGKSYQFDHDYRSALVFYDSARSTFERVGDKFALGGVENNVGMIYLEQQDNEHARFHFENAQNIARETGDTLGIARATMNLAIVLKRSGDFLGAARKYLEAQESFRQLSNKVGIATTYQNLADIYDMSGDLAKGLHNGEQAALAFQELRDARGVEKSHATMTGLSRQVGDYPEAVYHGLVALFIRRGTHNPEYDRSVAELSRLRDLEGERRFQGDVERALPRVRELLENIGFESVDLTIPAELTSQH
jgi:tetratricopeptide (TPR) repeat protein